MQLAATHTAPASTPQFGRWTELPQLAGTRTEHRGLAGHVIDDALGFDEFATELVGAWDFFQDGAISAPELRRTQQHMFGSNLDGSTEPGLFVWPATTIRQEVVSMEPLFAAAKGADELLTVAELAAFVRSFDANGNGFLDTRHHGDGTGDEAASFDAVSRPVVLGARQVTIEGKLQGVGHSIMDPWADRLRDAPLPPIAA